MRVAGTFSGIGGLEYPFEELGHECVLMCDVWEPSQRVLKTHFGGELIPDVAEVARRGLPSGTNVLTAGFPCTDLSQAGRTAGIRGAESGLVRHVFEILDRNPDLEWLALENVRNMLVLDGGGAMRFLTRELGDRGFRWAYRLVDSRFTGVPQRRQRVIMVASREHDPREVLFADEAGDPGEANLREDAFGFYWTEGLRGVGWARDAVPTLKGGSGLGIPSPPAIWFPAAPRGRRFGKPTIEHAEQLQGFPAGWTEPACTGRSNTPRWKLVGNAVTLGVGRWLVERLVKPGDLAVETMAAEVGPRWPLAGWGEGDLAFQVDASMWPLRAPYVHLTEIVPAAEAQPLSARAASGFLERAHRSTLRFADGFLDDLADHTIAVADAA
jgi:DNA (cytosine-5)-methyltransferase 1